MSARIVGQVACWVFRVCVFRSFVWLLLSEPLSCLSLCSEDRTARSPLPSISDVDGRGKGKRREGREKGKRQTKKREDHKEGVSNIAPSSQPVCFSSSISSVSFLKDGDVVREDVVPYDRPGIEVETDLLSRVR